MRLTSRKDRNASPPQLSHRVAEGRKSKALAATVRELGFRVGGNAASQAAYSEGVIRGSPADVDRPNNTHPKGA